jgi:hypothetical protein
MRCTVRFPGTYSNVASYCRRHFGAPTRLLADSIHPAEGEALGISLAIAGQQNPVDKCNSCEIPLSLIYLE